MNFETNNENLTPTWREPVQDRSRRRVDAILDAARGLIVETKATDIKMTEIASRAGVPIGSLYQFFPTRTALLSRLFELEMKPIDDALRASMHRASSLDELISEIEQTMISNLALVREQPCLFVIWSSLSADPVIRAADFENTRANAQALVDRIVELTGVDVDQHALHATTTVICHLWGSIIQLCFMTDDAGDAEMILTQYIKMIQNHLRGLLINPIT